MEKRKVEVDRVPPLGYDLGRLKNRSERMSADLPDEMKPGLEKLQAKMQVHLDALRKAKIAINALHEAFDLPAPYAETEEGAGTIKSIRRGQFYGQPLATNVRAILEMRRAANLDAASVTEIFQALRDGGYAFEAKDDENAKNGLRQSLRKNPIFHRIPSGEWGLMTWYPNARVEKDDDGDSSTNGSSEKKVRAEKTEAPAASSDKVAEAAPKTHSTKKREEGTTENEKAASVN